MDTTEPGLAHVHIDKQSPHAYRALVAVATAVTKTAAEAGLPPALVELVNTRVSLINGCPSCLEIHHRRAVKAGVTDKQPATLRAWRDTELFSEQERAALRLAEITTTLPDHDIAEREYARARAVLDDNQISAVIWVATAINAFNRVSILSRHRCGPRYRPAAGPAGPTRAAPDVPPRPAPRRPTRRCAPSSSRA